MGGGKWEEALGGVSGIAVDSLLLAQGSIPQIASLAGWILEGGWGCLLELTSAVLTEKGKLQHWALNLPLREGGGQSLEPVWA